jgi:amino acid adenylation domain-containing protein
MTQPNPTSRSSTVDSAAPATAATLARQRLLELRLRRSEAANHDAAIVRRPHDAVVPLSSSQHVLWFQDQLNGPSATHNITCAVHLGGALDASRLERSVRALVERHEALRTAFEPRDGVAVQVVQSPGTAGAGIALQPLRLSGGSAAQRELEAHSLLQTLADTPFDLARAPLLRAHLLQLGETEHVLLIVVHHIVFDGWSMGVLVRELGLLYAAGGDASGLAPLPIQFGDYALWQREQLAGDGVARQLKYWSEKLHGLEPLELPTDRPRPPRPSHRGGLVRFEVDAARLGLLKALALRENATLFMVLLSAFQVLLMRYSRQQDLAVGVPIAGRHRIELQGLIGYFINTLVMRTDLGGNPGFTELLGRVRRTALDAYGHQELPFDRLVSALGPKPDLSRNPLYQVAFVLQNTPESPIDLAGLQARRIDLQRSTSIFDLMLTMSEAEGGLRGKFEYASDLFDAATITRLAGHFQVLLAGIVADPAQPIATLPLLGQDERAQLLVAWNDTAQPYPLDQRLHELFEAQVARSPDAVAAVLDERSLSYAELNAEANRLAKRLRALGVGADVLVGVCMERSFELLVGMLAILKAGGAFLPLDPEYPEERLAFMWQDSNAPVVLTQPHLEARLSSVGAGRQTNVIGVRLEGGGIVGEPDLPSNGTMDQLAYAIYTSGSTGRPKGALITHRGVCNHVVWLKDAMRMTAADRVAHKTSISFDASIWEIFTPLICGASIVLARPGTHRDMQALVDMTIDQAVTVLQMVPSSLRVMLTEPRLAQCATLRYVVSGGEVLDSALASEFRRALPATTLGNFYGPSEAADDATWFEIGASMPPLLNVPIGRPIGNVTCYILDEHGQPVPVGVVGELHVGGLGVGRGYLHRPELTAQRFVPDPFQQGRRLYRTGDLARFLPDGNIEYVGRIDHQVKIRGQRVELGEIESNLNACPGVRQSVVQVREDRPGVKQLVAYVVVDDRSASELKEQMRARLPEYMVPQRFVEIAALPLLPNGKVDRRALPAPSHEATPDEAATLTDAERAVASIWQSLLDVGELRPGDNFFEVGGHSLLAMRVIARMQRELGLRVSVRRLVVESLAQIAATKADQLPDAAAEPAQPREAGLLHRLKHMLMPTRGDAAPRA